MPHLSVVAGGRAGLLYQLLTAGTKYLKKDLEEGFIWAHGLRVHPAILGSGWWQRCTAAGHVSTVRKQR